VHLKSAALHRVYSGPALRCRETVEGLAAARGLSVETEACLDESAQVRDVIGLLRALGDLPVLLCTHGPLIPELLQALGVRSARGVSPQRTEKGSLWLLEGPGLQIEQASYIPPLEAEPPIADPTRVAVLDLGSTNFTLLVADATATGEIEPVLRERASLRLGAVIADGDHIPESVCRKAIGAARALRAEAESLNADMLVPVATAAFRDARNGAELAERIGEVLDVPVRLLSGEQEARVSYGAIRRRVGRKRGPEPTLAVDLGGGSLELALDEPSSALFEATLPLGAARLHRELVSTDPLSKREARQIRERVVRELEPHRFSLRRCPDDGVVCGGTARALARLVLAQRGERPGRHIRRLQIPSAELAEIARRLRRSNHDERLRMRTMQRRRADLLPTGALILATLAEQLGLESFTVSDWGLREGVILETLGVGS
jgi:exopolyphosphatase/guanosine-5'-triphosphate,3'-diphosphate pyrophosphatase